MAEAHAASHDIIGAVEVEDVGDAAGNAVGQFAGHGVFGNLGQVLAHPLVQFAGDVAAHRLRQRGETGAFSQFVGVLRKVDAQRR